MDSESEDTSTPGAAFVTSFTLASASMTDMDSNFAFIICFTELGENTARRLSDSARGDLATTLAARGDMLRAAIAEAVR
jgi:hypothetical protein